MVRIRLASTTVCEASSVYFYARTTTGGGAVQVGSTGHALPYWVKVTRSGSTFSSYASLDGVNWTQLGTETITMATNTYVGLVVSSASNSTLATATFDNVSVSSSASPAPQITSLSATTGSVGSQIVITGTGFGASQSGSAVTLAGTPVTVNSWSGTAIAVTIPRGATSGPIVVCVAPTMTNSNPVYFNVTAQPLPTTWLDQDLGSVVATGTATFANGVYTVTGSGNGMSQASDNLHFVYQPLSGDGSIVARLVSSPGGEAGVMIRETLNSGSTAAFAFFQSYMFFGYRTTTGAAATVPGGTVISGLPYWLKLARSGNTFTAYISHNGLYWTQLGTTQTIAMGTNVYIGLAVSGTVSASDTSTFDNVSINSTVNPAPSITNLFGTTGPVGSALVVSGTGFGVSQGNSLVFLNGTPLTITNWTNTSILATIPTGATSGDVVVSVAPNMNDSNPMVFNVTASPLPVPWLDQDVGVDGLAGSATFVNGTFTVQGAGAGVWHASDAMHFVYQGLSGDGSIIARLASSQGTTEAGVMIRQSLDPGAVSVAVFKDSTNAYISFGYRTSAGASTTNGGGSNSVTLPYWVKLVRAGNTFSAYTSMNGYFWTQLGTTQTVTMSQDVLIGLFVDGQGVNLGTATFDGVSVSTAASPAPVINALSATTGPVGSEIQISGSGFGSSAGSSIVTLNGSPVTIDSWDSSSIIVTIPIGATSGPMVVSVAPSMNDSNPVGFTVTSQALPLPWLDQDIGPVSIAGSATYSGGVFTVKGAGNNMTGTADGMHFLYQPLTGDGSIVARLASVQGTVITAAAMIRGSLDPSAVDAYTSGTASNTYIFFYYRSTTGGTATDQGNSAAVTLPYWLKVVRNGNTLTGYMSPDGVTWSQVNASETITMPQTIYVGMAVGTTSATLSTATFDNVSIINGSTPVVTGISPALAGIGWSITITGSNFGATQGTSTVTFNGAAATSITSWSNSQIVALVPAGATTGPVAVTVNSIQSVANPTITILNPVITSVSPPGAELGGQVTVAGSGFGNYVGSVGVSINGVTQHVYASSDTSIQFTVVSGTTSGPLTASVQGGINSNSVPFTIEPTISITGISPTAGSPADVVTITGTGFGSTQSDSVVTFDGVTANVITWSDTSIQAVVPAGAATGPVTVEVADRTADGPVFTVSGATVVTDSLGNQSTYVSAIAGGNWDVTTAQGSGCSSCTIRGNLTYQYDISGHVVSTTDELGNLTSNTYDSNGNVTSVTQPTVTGGTPITTYTYNSFGEVLTMTDPLGNVTTNTYDAHGNLLTVTTPKPNGSTAASKTQFAYNSLGELTSITDPLGRITAITYTPQGYIATITDPQNNVTTYAYDSRGNRTSVTDAMSNVTTFAYDTGNRLTGITYPDQTTASFTYDYRGRRITATDQNGKTTTYAYDDADRLTSVTDAAGNVTSYTYDTENNLLSITDANQHTTSFAYDAFGRVTKTTFPSGNIETYQYDADNNLTSKTDRNSNTIQYVYDALNRLTQKNEPGAISAEYTYDLVGKILQVNDPTGTYAFAYDNMGRLTGTTTTYSFLPNTPYTNSYSYDADSNRTGFTAPDGSTNTYTYDTLNRLSTLANSWAGSFGFSYDALSRRTQMTRPNGIATNYSYDKLSHLLSVLHQAGTSTIDGDAYTLDAAGNRTAKTDYLAGVTSNYTYDKIYELTQVMQGTNTTESYSYDAVGNRLSSLGVASYSYNNSNELTSSSQGGYTYDANGNTLTDASGKSYAWDFENHLEQVTLPNSGGTVAFLYDPFGRRIQKVYTTGANPPTTTTTNYLYDGDNEIEQADSNGNLLSRFAQAEDIDQPLARSASGTTSFYEQDGLGSVTSLTNSSGTLAQSYAFDSFGKIINFSGNIANPFRYTGRDFDSETGLYSYRARYYDPGMGRFLSEDPSGFKAGANFYIYVANDPQDSTDPTGLYKLTGFTPEQTVDFNNAVNDLKKKLEGCPSCVSDPSLRNRLLGFLNGGNNGSGINFIFSKTKLGPGYCAQSDGVFGRTHIADWKTTPGCQCLPKTIVHELVHQTWKNVFTFWPFGDPENEPANIDRGCYPKGTCKW